MCTYSRTKPELQTADKDIVVYKQVQNFEYKKFLFFNILKSCKSFIRYFTYKKNKIYETKLEEFSIIVNYFVSGKGFYSYKERKPNIYTFTNAKFIIPKGSKYYLVETMNGVYIYHSNKIKFIGKI